MAFSNLCLLHVVTVLTLTTLQLAYATPVQFKDCGSSLATIKSVDVTPCPSLPCPFQRKTNVSVVMEFTANADISASGTKVYGLILGQLVPFPLPDENACHCMPCPIKKGTIVTYKNSIYVKEEYPKLQLVVEWKLVSGSDVVTCFTLPAKITD
ncbi:epididymal secretory protein E1 [Elysia marginata]|uniref:Epididymal secretory protein E1 n=1 Tax=Elysia marginata TaxID=1093978 RepID=A0AAV4F573_9GAST|nr:epididymal secretory protein E1 [Elysia marginata]